jgi:flagellar protein FlaG
LQQDRSTNRAALTARQTESVDGKGLPLRSADRSASAEQVEAAVSQISEFIQSIQRDLVFSIDESSERLVVKIVDSKTHEVIRQIPSEEMLRIARHLDTTGSLILREQA